MATTINDVIEDVAGLMSLPLLPLAGYTEAEVSTALDQVGRELTICYQLNYAIETLQATGNRKFYHKHPNFQLYFFQHPNADSRLAILQVQHDALVASDEFFARVQRYAPWKLYPQNKVLPYRINTVTQMFSSETAGVLATADIIIDPSIDRKFCD